MAWSLMGMLHRLADNESAGSLASRFRRQRFELFRGLVERVGKPLRILDVGGTERFWDRMGFGEQKGVEIVLLNLVAAPTTRPSVRSVAGDARAMTAFAEGEFDVVFSNSVIEHVGDWEDQRRMATEVKRVGRRYFVQTPNRYFPLEPHFLVPMYQFMPVDARVWLLRRFKLGHVGQIPDADAARRAVISVRLLTRQEMSILFPDGTIHDERILGLAKSFIAYGGW